MNEKLQKALISKDAYTVGKYLSKGDDDCSDNAFLSVQLHKHKWSLIEVTEIENPDLTKVFLEGDGSIDIDATDDDPPGYTALHKAVSELDIDHVELFLDYDANPNSLDDYSRTPLHLLYCDEEQRWDHESGLEILEMLIDHGAEAVTVIKNSKILQVKYTLESGDEDVIKTVMSMKIDMKARYQDGDTVAHCLARNAEPGIFEIMRDREFDVNARNDAQETPLHGAAGLAFIETVQFLLRKGADVNAADSTNRTPIYRTIRSYNLSKHWDEDHLECAMILLENSADLQVAAIKDGLPHTIFDIIFEKHKDGKMCKVILEHLAVQEATGTTITSLILGKINSNNGIKQYHVLCRQLLTYKVYQSETLLVLLTCNEEKLIPYMRNEELVEILFSHCDKVKSMDALYYHRLLQKRLTKAKKVANLRDLASTVLGKLMDINHSCHPLVLDTIMKYLNFQDLNSLLKV